VKKIAIIPTLLTLANGACGFAAIIFASKIGGPDTTPAQDPYFALAGWMIIAAMLFDSLDGYVARLSKTTSKFGAELDSLCDAISFGVAPAFLLLRLGPAWDPSRPILHQLVIGIAVLYMVCAVLRLARFNIETPSDPNAGKKFRGLPSPGAAGCLASLGILRGDLALKLVMHLPNADPEVVRQTLQRLIEFWAPAGALLIALLMVSRIPYPHLTKQVLRGKKHFGHLIQVILVAFIILLIRELALVLIFWMYAVGIALRYVVLRSLRVKGLPAPGLDDIVRR
jgi:CDP-diacylglycerol--serine O-phosphatidyltransferase